MNLKTRLRSLAARHFSSQTYLEKKRAKAVKQRQQKGEPPTVHYFHQADDPYSHLAVQKLDQLQAAYDVQFRHHLVSQQSADYLGSADHFDHWALADAASVADDYGVQFAPTVTVPDNSAVACVNAHLAQCLDQPDFAQQALELGQQLWSGQSISSQPSTKPVDVVARGNQLREQLGHYQGAMLYFDGEWFWGIDRMRSLELRLIDEGLQLETGPLCVPEPTPIDTTNLTTSNITLEYFPSLRSPYTAIGHTRFLDLVKRSGVQVKVRPVMPMLMRGIPAPRAKQRYIIMDSAREGREHGAPMGKIVDPFGEPVKRAFALFPAMQAQQRELEFVTAYLSAAWVDGVDITTTSGLQQVVESAGADWSKASASADDGQWQTILQTNLDDMFQSNLWGVPSFRVSGGHSNQPFACWGQDRIWRVENEIARRS